MIVDSQGEAARFLSTLLMACTICAQSSPKAPSNPNLAAQIEQLLQTELSQDHSNPSTLSQVRQIFVQYGVPTIALVGQRAAEDYIVLAAHDQTLAFLQQLLPAAKSAVTSGGISLNSYTYLHARLTQRRVEESATRKPTHPELSAEIEGLFRADQDSRQKSQFSAKRMSEVDRRNAAPERAIFAKYGVPTYVMVGLQPAKDFIVLIQHQPLEFLKQVLPKLKANVDIGQADPSNYAEMFDRVQTDENKPQRYGMNFICTPEGKLEPSPIEDIAHLDQRRAEMGLLPMRLYSKLVIENFPQGFCQKVGAARKKNTKQ